MPELERLQWDTDFFGFGVGRIQPASPMAVAKVVSNSRQQGLRLLYWLVDPQDREMADAADCVGARLVDRKVTFLAQTRISEVDLAIRPAADATEKLYLLAIQSGHYSRFKVDAQLPKGCFERMYSLWLKRSVAGEIAKAVFVYGEDQGFITLGVKNGRLDIGLLAVDEAVRSQGIGRKLVSVAFARARDWKLPAVQVVTQGDNLDACHFYERCGFQVHSVQNCYHLWL